MGMIFISLAEYHLMGWFHYKICC